MNWKLKSKIQNTIAALPPSLSYPTYYWLQRHFGNLRRINPVKDLEKGIKICRIITSLGKSIVGSTFFELGTGHRLNVPLAYWLMGAETIVTVDKNPYLMEELVREAVNYIRDHREQILELFADRIHNNRWNELLESTSGAWSLKDFLRMCRINYLAPCDAADLSGPSDFIDFYTSCNVLEHIPPEIVADIIRESNRIVRHGGLFVHKIDHSDHFAHSDKTISLINFLQYDDVRWNKIAGNRFMYTNRLREDDYIELICSNNQRILVCDSIFNDSVRELLREGSLKLVEKFRAKSEDVLATTSSSIVSEKCK